MPDWLRWARSVRFRTTVLATLVVGVALSVTGFAIVALQEDALTDNVDTAITLRGDDLASLLIEDSLPRSIAALDDEIALVQVVNTDGEVIRASDNAIKLAPVSDLRPPAGVVHIEQVDELPIEDDGFRVLARGVPVDGETVTLIVAGSLETVHESGEALVAILRQGIPLLTLAVGVGTWFVVGRALAPVEGIRAEVSAITSRELGRRVPEPGTGDEIARLATTMNEMLERLETAQSQQDRFVADASHELRSPLAGIRTEIEVDLAHPGDAEWQTTMQETLNEVVRMQDLIHDLLELAAGDAGATTAQEPVDLDDIVLREAGRMREAGTLVDVQGVSGGQVLGDYGQLTRAIRNVVENAARHANSRVAVSVDEEDGVVVVAVTDDGPGVPPEMRDRVFDRFARGDSARGRNSGGTGLGLAIVKAIAEGHGGSILLDTGHTQGARFVLRLPTSPPNRGATRGRSSPRRRR